MLNGTDVLLLIEDPATPDSFIPVKCQMDGSIDENRDTIDYSCKDSDDTQLGYGRYSSSVSLDVVVVPDNATQAAIRSAIRNATPTEMRKQVSEVEIESASIIITGLSESFPDQDKSQWSISGEVDGSWTSLES